MSEIGSGIQAWFSEDYRTAMPSQSWDSTTTDIVVAG